MQSRMFSGMQKQEGERPTLTRNPSSSPHNFESRANQQLLAAPNVLNIKPCLNKLRTHNVQAVNS